MRQTKQNRRLRRGRYTIVEMMMVVAVFMIILGMAIAAWLNSGSQAKLKNAVRLVNAQLNLARSKAVAERRNIGVYFAKSTDDYYRYGCRLFYDDNKNGSKNGTEEFLTDEWVTLPGGVVFAVKAGGAGADPKAYFTTNGVPTEIVFDAKGRVVTGSYGGDLYLTPGTHKEGPLQTGSYKGEPYFKIEINGFNGRANTTYYEVND